MFPDKGNRYNFTPETVDVPMFCSKNYKPPFHHLERFAHKFCENSKRHSPDSPLLLGNLNDTDIVTECREQSLLKPKDNTLRPDL